MTIHELIHQIQFNDDESAFNELYKQHIVKLYQFAYSFLDDREAGEEIVNDVFLRIWIGRKNLNSIRNIQVYLYVAVKNACLNHLRSISSKRVRELKLTEAYYFHLSIDPAQLLISKELQTEVLKAINELPPRCRLIFRMVKEDDLSCNEVATILGLSNKTVFAQLTIALKKLDQALRA
ncbi:RNA polymerase sigma-70 factor [Mucilaginibacter sp.]|uniref:RNA polymerase sigma-70 factor n=1 Tax=Mucilaginibacter sp. TaxID=1882438 RepID=UPI00262DB5A2|nr:RNA polymerase sigma-70 factor [Mucilaginibacter sp.]MDB4919689.1 polymerase sigma-70 factor [Mucilaginibacter sp.]